MSDFLDAALNYAYRGWHIFPCKPRGKTPLTRHGFKDATIHPDRVREMWGRWPDANIGIATGAISNLVVFDYDGEKGKATLARIITETVKAQGEMPLTLCARTARGWHLYYRPLPDQGDMRSSSDKENGIDVRANGGFVLAPPSIHPSGAIYSWWLGHPGDAASGRFVSWQELGDVE